MLSRHDQRNREVVAVGISDRGLRGALVDRRFHGLTQRAQRHRRDHVRARIDVFVATRVDGADLVGAVAVCARCP